MTRWSGRSALLIASLFVLGASQGMAQVKKAIVPIPKPVTKPITQAPGTTATNAAPAVPASLHLAPGKAVIGAPVLLTVGMATAQAAATTFRVLSDLGTSTDVSIPAGQTTASASQALPALLPSANFHFCVTPDLREVRHPCTNGAAKSAILAPWDAATIQIARVRINGDDGTGTVVVPRGQAFVVEVNLNAIPAAANITVKSDVLNSYSRLIYATKVPVASDAPFVPLKLALGGKRGVGVVSAELNGKTVTRNIEILPLKQVDKTCFFDDAPTAGWWRADYDFCTHEIVPGKVTGGQTAYGFVRRNFASQEAVYLELSSSDPSIATVTPASTSVGGSLQRGLSFTVKTVPTGGTPRTVTIKVVEGGTYEYLMTLTIR